VEDGRVRDFPGTFEAFTAMRQREAQQRAAVPQPVQKKEAAQPRRGDSRAAEKQKRELERRARALEQQIDALDGQMAGCGDDYQKLNELYQQKEESELQLLELYEQIEALQA
jgi:hypothetical protein